MRYSSSENGRSMIEMLGVLAIVGILSTGAISGYSKAMLKHKTNKTVELITQMSMGIKTAFSTQKNYSGSGNIDTLNKLGIIPSNIIKEERINLNNTPGLGNGGGRGGRIGIGTGLGNPNTQIADRIVNTCSNPFNGEIEVVEADKKETDDQKAFIVRATNLPTEACSTLVSLIWSNSDESLVSVGINTEDDMQSPECESSDTLFCGDEDVSVAEIISACNNNTNNVAFKFY